MKPDQERAMQDAGTPRKAFYRRIGQAHLTPLWESMSALVPRRPASLCVPALWKYAEVRPWLMESGSLISAREAVRRVLILENPGMRGQSAITNSLYAGWQLILPGEVAPAHRHSQTALRLIVEGSGAYTAVEGERVTMHPGDFIITPSWTWHDHGNPGAEPVVWLDGLDIPLVRFLEAGFAEDDVREEQAIVRPEGDAWLRYGNNLRPVAFVPRDANSPVFAYPYARTRESLAQLAKVDAPHPVHGHKMEFINPATGGPAMPTMGAYVQWMSAGFPGKSARSTDGTVYSVIEGEGTVRIEDREFAFGARDTFVVPAWNNLSFRTRTDVVLFSFSDRPVQKALGLFRESSPT
ncbi:MAG: gentisate 1,2-dioxygenase [Burkholderiales bacterium]